MNISDLTKRHLFGSIDKSKIPGTLTDYKCQLVIQQYQQDQDKIYFKFTPKQQNKSKPFILNIQKLLQPKNLIYSYHIIQKQSNNAKIIMGDKQQLKIQSSIKVEQKQTAKIDQISQSGGDEYYQQQDIQLRHLQFMKDYSDDQEQQSRYQEQVQYDKNSIKGLLIQFLNNQQNKRSKLKDIKMYLMNNNIKINQNKLKIFLGEICSTNVDKKLGYVLKDQFIEGSQYEKMPRKMVKDQ